ncbi:MAG: serine/threonine protein kinase, partial [Kiritimatiellia bacterium]
MAVERRRFHLSLKLGEGAHGQVFLAELESLGGFRRKVVLKLLHPELAHTTEAACRMRDEARILGRLAHRHIVTVIDLVRLNQRWAMVMDHLPGADLDRVLRVLTDRGELLPIPGALQAGTCVLSALNAAWTGDNGSGKPLRIVHRDIKPSNILLTEDGEIKVLDFGVARVDMEDRESKTGQFRFGTERYMGPERLIGEEDTPAGDVYATAATVTELILGEPMGRSPVLTDRHATMLDGVRARLVDRLPDHPKSPIVIDSLILAMAAEPTERPTASDLAAIWRDAARAIPGDGLELFAQSFFPNAIQLLNANHTPVDGMLEESISLGQTTGLPFDEPVTGH